VPDLYTLRTGSNQCNAIAAPAVVLPSTAALSKQHRLAPSWTEAVYIWGAVVESMHLRRAVLKAAAAQVDKEGLQGSSTCCVVLIDSAQVLKTLFRPHA